MFGDAPPKRTAGARHPRPDPKDRLAGFSADVQRHPLKPGGDLAEAGDNRAVIENELVQEPVPAARDGLHQLPGQGRLSDWCILEGSPERLLLELVKVAPAEQRADHPNRPELQSEPLSVRPYIHGATVRRWRAQGNSGIRGVAAGEAALSEPAACSAEGPAWRLGSVAQAQCRTHVPSASRSPAAQ